VPCRRRPGRDEARPSRQVVARRDGHRGRADKEGRSPESRGGAVDDPTDPVGRLLFNVFGMVAEFEADLIRTRTREGMAIAKAAGKLRGRKPKLTPSQEKHLVQLHRSGAHTTSEIAEIFGVARSTVYRALQCAQQAQSGLLGIRMSFVSTLKR